MSRLPHEVIVVVRREDEYLVLHRSPRQGSYWHLVAGAREPGETPAEAAARELGEEVGLEAAGLVDLARSFVYVLGEETARAREVRVDCFLVEAPPRWEPRLDWEHDEARWCGHDEAVRLLFWPEPRELLQAVADAAR